ncbi:CoA-transferase [Buchnera aphidicola (Diuraphis noxia)]|uniref:Co-chaperone protein HscB n=1 Tax=Buchnera aphidicola subsp. Diuraphis noxia TaxID=118101 RepID=A0A1B2H976_BUCDN|nr:Fe-S protein assembly co-chaperone HscB [Buchnera aphidicola]ANZ22773.1 CoA-transferase [Buchnera aphidicola (Diuraphis noxia)]
MNYFKLFNVPKKFNIDRKILSENFYKLQLQFHPDLFVNHSVHKKKIILEKSIEINKGYKTLKHFLTRSVYLLSLYDIKIEKETIFSNNHIFLKEYFSLYEELDNLKKNDFNKVLINNFFEKITKNIYQHQEDINCEFEKRNFKKIVILVEKLFFFERMKISLKNNMHLK